jgi:dTDP-4-dehydrorhamnose 3,5-epimerase-like enzyme
MEIINLDLDGLYLIKPKIYEDNRGYFFESYMKMIPILLLKKTVKSPKKNSFLLL